MNSFLIYIFLSYFIISSQIEKYFFTPLFEKAKKELLIQQATYAIPIHLTSWNLSFWTKIEYLNSTSTLISISNKNIDLNFNLDYLTKGVLFEDVRIGNFFNSSHLRDFEDLIGVSTNWFFISLNYNFKRFQIFCDNGIIPFLINQEFLYPQNTQLIFTNSSTLNSSILFAHVHFFAVSIPLEDFEDIKYYPKNIPALYKFSLLKANHQIIINLLNDQNSRNLRIANQNRIPFKNHNSFVQVKMTFPKFNRSIVIKNLIIVINANIIFRNNIKNNSSYQTQNWTIKWYSRLSEKTIQNFTCQTQVNYSTITLNNHIATFKSQISENNLTPDFNVGRTHNLRLGDWKRDDYNLEVLTIVQIKDIPMPNNQARLKELSCNIPIINYNETLNYHFDLSYYDEHYFEIDKNPGEKVVMYLILNEILVSTGNEVFENLADKAVYLGKEKKVLLKCRKTHDLLRVYPDNNSKIILDQCIDNDFDDLKCPFISNCIYCNSRNCVICKEGYVNLKYSCVICDFPKIIVRNICLDNANEFNPQTHLGLLDSEFHLNNLIALNVKLASLTNISDLNSDKKEYNVSLFYYINDLDFENPTNFFGLLDLADFVVKKIYFLILTETIQNNLNLNNPYGCSINNSFFMLNSANWLLGKCLKFCDYLYLSHDGFCFPHLYDCVDIHIQGNRCQKCQTDYSMVVQGNSAGNDYYTCYPQIIIDMNEIQNELIFKSDIYCTDINCALCSISSTICYKCNDPYIIHNSICVLEIRNCQEVDNYGACINCLSGYTFIPNLNRCIVTNSVIDNCGDYELDINEFCIRCQKDFSLIKYNKPIFQCVRDYMKIEFCKVYSNGPNFSCLICLENFFLFQKQTDFLLNYICISNKYLTPSCIDYDEFTFKCLQCQNGLELVQTKYDINMCVKFSSLITNCLLYNENLQCEKYQQKCNYDNLDDCPICNYEQILVNGDCVDYCSKTALTCEDCEQTCPLYLCKKFVPSCLQCDTLNYVKCNLCEPSFILKDGYCYPSAYIDYYKNLKLCVEGCADCFNRVCFKCKFGYEFDKEKRICLLNNKVIQNDYNFINDICNQKTEFKCIKDSILFFQHCFNCQRKCNCEINYVNKIAFLNCKNNSVVFTLQKDQKYIYFLKDLDVSVESFTSLKFLFRDKHQKRIFINIPRYLIKSSTNCTFDNFKFYMIKNSFYIPKIKNQKVMNVFSSKLTLLPMLSNLIPKAFGLFLLFFQLQEIMTYLYLINFNGGQIYQYIYDLDITLYKFPDLNSEKNEYEKQFIFQIDNYDYFNFLECADLFMIGGFILRELAIFIYILIMTLYYYYLNNEVFHDEFFKTKMLFMLKRSRMFLNSFFSMLAIKNFAKSKRFYSFHTIFPNMYIELAFIIFHFSVVFLSLNYLRNVFSFTRKDEDYEDINYEDDYANLNKPSYRDEDIILNRISILTYLLFFLRTFLIQNYYNFIIAIDSIVFLSYFIYIIYLIIRLVFGKKVKVLISIYLTNEVIFFIYLILGQSFLSNFIHFRVLDVFFIICYISKVLEAIYSLIFFYLKNNVKSIPEKPKLPIGQKSFYFPKELLIKLDMTNPLNIKHYGNYQ